MSEFWLGRAGEHYANFATLLVNTDDSDGCCTVAVYP